MKFDPNKEINFQIGKAGLNESTVQTLNVLLERHKRIRISVLKSAEKERQNMKSLAQNLSLKLSHPSIAKPIGFTIILRRISELKAHHDRQKKK